MNKLLILLLIIDSINVFGQTESEKRKISEFKRDFLDKTPMYKPDTLRIDSLTFVREKYPNVRVIKTFTKNRNIVYYDYYCNGTNELESTSTYDTMERPVEITKRYTYEGVLDYILDYDKGKWSGFLSKQTDTYEISLISNFRHLDKPETISHPLAGESFDYLGFQTEQQVINEMHGDNRLAFDYNGRIIKFGENIYSWDFEQLEDLLTEQTEKNFRDGNEFSIS